jgi:riboflavin synthase
LFTGIVRELGEILSVERISGGLRLRIGARESLNAMCSGDSIAVNGICQTVVAVDSTSFTTEAVGQTLRMTTVAQWRRGDSVNLESPLRAKDQLGGHMVTGHVDGIGFVRRKEQRAGDVLLLIEPPGELLTQIFARGSIAVDGVSLTVVDVRGEHFAVTLIPHTLRETTLRLRRVGDAVNLETDMIVKAVQGLLRSDTDRRGLTRERLEELGY